MKNVIYQGAWVDPSHTHDEEGDPFRPHLIVTEEVNGYLVWLLTPTGYTDPLMHAFNRSHAIEYAVERVLKHRADVDQLL